MTKGKRWVSICELSLGLKALFPEFIFPQDHPKKLRCVIKLYQSSFEWKKNGNIILVKRKENDLP